MQGKGFVPAPAEALKALYRVNQELVAFKQARAPQKSATMDMDSTLIEPMFSDFKSRGFGLEDTQLRDPERVDHLVLILTLAMDWCTQTGYRDAQEAPTPLEKTTVQTDPNHWSFRKLARSSLSWFQRGLRKLLRLAELGQPLPLFASSG